MEGGREGEGLREEGRGGRDGWRGRERERRRLEAEVDGDCHGDCLGSQSLSASVVLYYLSC